MEIRKDMTNCRGCPYRSYLISNLQPEDIGVINL